jgi:hypothetical protein
MGLQDLYEQRYGNGATSEEEVSKEAAAEIQELEAALENFSDEEVGQLQAAGQLLDSFGYEFENGHQKLAASAELLDNITEEGEEAAAADGGEAATDDDDSNIVVTEDGQVFQYLGTEEELTQTQEDEKTAADAEAQGRFMARAFHDELQKLQS